MTSVSKLPLYPLKNNKTQPFAFHCKSYYTSLKSPEAMNSASIKLYNYWNSYYSWPSFTERPLVPIQQASKKEFANTSGDVYNKLDIAQPKNVELILRSKNIREIYELDVLKNAQHAKLVKLGLSRAFLMGEKLAPNSGAANIAEKTKIFQLGLNWLFDVELGFYCEDVLSNLLNNNITRCALKKAQFLAYQNNQEPFFRKGEKVTQFSLNIVKLFFDKANLARIVRLLLSAYNPLVFAKLTPSQHYKLLSYLIHTTRQKGNYDLINSLFNPLTLNNNSIKNSYFSFHFEPF